MIEYYNLSELSQYEMSDKNQSSDILFLLFYQSPRIVPLPPLRNGIF